MKLKFLKKYAYAFDGYRVAEYAAGDVVDAYPGEFAATAVSDGAAEEYEEKGGAGPQQNKSGKAKSNKKA